MQEWTLEADNGGNIQFTFVSFDVEYTDGCSKDYVEVIYGDISEILQCGDYDPRGPFTSCGGHNMVIRFHSDDSDTRPGFHAEWEELSTSTPCPN